MEDTEQVIQNYLRSNVASESEDLASRQRPLGFFPMIKHVRLLGANGENCSTFKSYDVWKMILFC